MKHLILSIVVCITALPIMSMDRFLEHKELARKNWQQKNMYRQMQSLTYQKHHNMVPLTSVRKQEASYASQKPIHKDPINDSKQLSNS